MLFTKRKVYFGLFKKLFEEPKEFGGDANRRSFSWLDPAASTNLPKLPICHYSPPTLRLLLSSVLESS